MQARFRMQCLMNISLPKIKYLKKILSALMENNEKELQQKTNYQQNDDSQTNHLDVKVSQPLLKVNADVQEPVKYGCMWVITVIIVLAIFLIALALPSVLVIKSNQKAFLSQDCMNPLGFDGNQNVYCGKFSNSTPTVGLLIDDISDLNQFAEIWMGITVSSLFQTYTLTINQTTQIQLYAIQRIEGTGEGGRTTYAYQYVSTLLNVTHEFYYFGFTHKFDTVEDDDKRPQDDHYSRVYDDHEDEQQNDDDDDQKVDPNKKYISWTKKFYDNRLINDQTSHTLLLMKFTNTAQLSSVENIEFMAYAVNPAYTVFSITIRYVFLVLAIVGSAIYLRRYFQLQAKDRIVEIKLVAILSILQVFFNDPLYAATALAPNPVTTFFSTFFVINFEIYNLFFFLIMVSRIYYERSSRQTQLDQVKKAWPKIVLFSALFILCMVVFLQAAYLSYESTPIVAPSELYKESVIVPAIMTLLVFGGIVVWTAFIYGLVIGKCCNNELLWRQKQVIIFLPFFFVLFCIVFLVEGLKSYHYESAIWPLYGFCFSNLFCFIMQYLFYTPKSALEDSHHHEDMQLAHSEINSDLDFESQEG